jgi:hypothetical protein
MIKYKTKEYQDKLRNILKDKEKPLRTIRKEMNLTSDQALRLMTLMFDVYETDDYFFGIRKE